MTMSNKQNKQSRKAQMPRDGLRTHIREELTKGSVQNIDARAVTATILNGGTSGSYNYVLSPLGLTSAYLSSGNFIAGGNVDPPHLRKLYGMALDFKYYRVLSGKLIFVPNYGSTQPGQLVMSSSRDVGDSSNYAQSAYSSGPNYKTFNLSLVTKEISVVLDVDTSWKKVTTVLSVPGQSIPFTGTAGAATIIPVNTVNDLCFSGVAMTVSVPTAVTADTSFGVFMVDYEIEFKGIIDSAVNS